MSARKKPRPTDASFILTGESAQAVANVADMLARTDMALDARTRRLMAGAIAIAFTRARIVPQRKGHSR